MIRWRRWLWAVPALAVLWTLAGWALPPLLKWQAESRLSSLLGRAVSVGEVSFSPWALKLGVSNLAIAAAPAAASAASSAEPLLRVARIEIDAAASSLLRLAPVIESVQIDAPRLHLTRTADGHYDIDDLLARLAPKPEAKPAEPARFALYNLSLRDGEVLFDDVPVKRRHRVSALQVALPFISNQPSQVEVKVEPRIAFALNGTAFDSAATATPFASNRAGVMSLRIKPLDLAPYLGYLPATLPVAVRGGRVAADLSLAFAAPAGAAPQMSLKGSVEAGDLVVTERGGEPLLDVKRLTLGLSDIQPLARKLALGRLELDGLRLTLARNAKGEINLARLAPAAAPAASAPAAAAQPAWQLSLDALELGNARVLWNDATTQPAAALMLDDIKLSLRQLRQPSVAPSPLTLSAVLKTAAKADTALGKLALDGQVSETAAGLKLELSALALDALTPYLSGVLRPQATGSMAVTGQLDWAAAAAPQAQRLKLTLEQLTLDAFKLGDLGTAATRQARDGMSPPGRPKGEYRSAQREGTPMSLARLELGASEVDLMARTATLASIKLQGPELRVERTSDGVWNVQRWAAAAAAAPAQVAAAEPWKLVLKSFALEGGKVQFIDAGARPAGGSKQGEPVRLDISQLKVGVQGLQLSGERTLGPAQVQLSARVASGGATRERGTPSGLVDWRGQFGVQPLLLRGTARIERLPVQALQAYFAQALNVSVLRADAGYRGGLTLQQAGSGFNLSAQGDVLVSDVLVHSRPDAAGSDSATEELLSWQKLSLDGVNIAMRAGAAPKVEVREAALSDFYSRLILTEQGRFNLQEVAPAAAAAASAPASGASASAAPSASPASGPPLDISIGATKLANGRIDFSDRFIRPNYSAALTELNGNLGAFRSGTREMATLELHGRAAGTALLEIIGQINPTAAPLALDIKAKATDLELAPLSPYAGKYAGYAIERGKLSMDVQYRIDPDGRLEAKNQVILNQLTFGDKIESASATKLPVRLAVALLTDRNGVIDINLPVSGSINDPQFSVGGIIIKVIINILTKAFTAPFALLAGGGSEDVSLVEFKPGTALFTDGGNSVVAKVAKALADRPALKMTVTGAADPASEREAFQRATLEQRLVQERRREQLRSSAAASAPDDALALDAADRARLLKEVYKQTELPDKPRNVIGLAKDIPAAEMETLLRNQVRVSVEAVRELALQRGLAVRDALIAKGLANERLFLAAPKLRVSGEDDAAWTPRVQLTLSTN